MEPNEIFELIIKADEKIKYAKPGKGDLRAGQARELLEQARDAAREIDNDALVEQAERRLADLDALRERIPDDDLAWRGRRDERSADPAAPVEVLPVDGADRDLAAGTGMAGVDHRARHPGRSRHG